MDVTAVLLNAQSPDANLRQAAEQQLEQAKMTNLPLLMSLMANELGDESKDLHVRQAAGLVLKNCLAAKDLSRQQHLAQQWLQTEANAKQQIKMQVLSTLGSAEQKARHTAAQAIAAMATIDLPQDQWPELVPGLVNNVTQQPAPQLKQSSLEALGYICEEIEPAVLVASSNLILTAVIQGMKEADMDVRIAGTNALYNALEFVKANFENETERNYIMQTVCETTQVAHKELRFAAFECIVRVAELYYDKLPSYMQALFQLTLQAIKTATETGDPDHDEVAQQAIEFWSTLCDEELELIEEMAEAAGALNPPAQACHYFVRGAAPHLVPAMLEAMCKQAEDDDDDTWSMAMAAATCLSRVAQATEDEVVQYVIPFVELHLTSADWHRREAATLAFGSILEGPSQSVLAPYLTQALDMMIKLMRDINVQVKDTAAWTIGRICEHHIRSINAEQWQMMTRPLQPGETPDKEGVLLTGLRDDPRVANNVCWALHNLAEHCEDTRDEPTNVLSGLFVELARALLVCTERSDAGEHNLRSSAYEALNTTLANAAEDTKPRIEQLLPAICQKLEQTFLMQIVSNDDREAQSELQGLLCGSLQVMTQKLAERAVPFADKMMELFIQVFASKNSTVHEEALMAVGAIANATEASFEKYMPHFRPFLSLGLSNSEEHQVCAVAVGVVGDICRALESKVVPYCDELVHLLLRNAQNPNLNRDVKPPILSCFGDIALAVGGQFDKYLQVTMSMLQQASLTEVDLSNPDLVDYLQQLREGIFEAYTGILQGLREDNKSEAFLPYVDNALALVHQVANALTAHPETVSDDLIRAAVGVVGDLAMSLGAQFKQLAKQAPHKDYMKHLMRAAKASRVQGTRDVGRWAFQTVFERMG